MNIRPSNYRRWLRHRVSRYQFIVFWAWEAFLQHGGRHARSNMRGHKNIKGSDRSEISVQYLLCVNDLNTKPNKFLKPEVPSLNLIAANIYFRSEHLDRSRAKGANNWTWVLRFIFSHFITKNYNKITLRKLLLQKKKGNPTKMRFWR